MMNFWSMFFKFQMQSEPSSALPSKARRWMLAGWCLAMLASLVLALMPVQHLQWPLFNWWDKAQHALAFALLTGWALLLWPQRAFRVGLAMLAFGAWIELAQGLTGWRFAEWADWLADAVGVLAVWVAWRVLLRSR